MSGNSWNGGYVEWQEGNAVYLSVVFSWLLDHALERARFHRFFGYEVRAGGPAIELNPGCMGGFAEEGGAVNALPRHNPNATFTTRGCVRKCAFCAVPRLEGALRELPDEEWEPKPLVCDNNLLAASQQHFDHVVDRLLASGVTEIDFNQGLDARLLTEHHAQRVAELAQAGQLKVARLAWDWAAMETIFRRAHGLLRDAGIPARRISVYVLIGYDDTPEDALHRLRVVWDELKSWPFPMRYQPLDARRRNEYVGEHWSHEELRRYYKYWSNLMRLSAVPFDKFTL